MQLQGDATRLAQVLQNLLINAAKFTPEAGHIELKVWQDGTQLYTSVSDNGAGISPQALSRIFELFSQGDAQTSAREGGLGIGLTLARSLVEMHGGTLRAESEGPGRGSRFTFFLPNAQISADGTAGPPGRGPSATVLVVDDNKDAANSLAEILRLMDCQVNVAYDGPAALELFRTQAPQAILMDLGMPGMNGYEVLSLRSLHGGERVTVAALTGFGTDEDKQRTLEAGFDEHLTKPLDFAALQAFLQTAGLVV
jgi:CheY-like chemotaxis protein/anti-sigma regulatory factor (Ser/Thr protein kinase)